MLRNQNQSDPVRRLARRSIRANRRRNLTIMLTIAFTTCVLSVIALAVAAAQRIAYEATVVRGWHVEVRGATNEQLKAMESDPEIARVGIKQNIGMIHLHDATVKIAYYDEVMWCYNQNASISGSRPREEGEVGISTGYLALLGVEAGLHDAVLLDLGYGPREYTITALLDDAATGAGSYYVFVPPSSYNAYACGADGRHIAFLWLRGINPVDRQGIETAARRLEERYDFGDGYVSTYTPAFQYSLMYPASHYVAYVGIGLSICAAGIIVIFTIFYISVSSRVREFGQMRTLGATHAQVRRLILYEGAILAPAPILLGLFIGGLCVYRIRPQGWHWPTALLLFGIVAVVAIIGVFIGISKPAKIAAETSPMEALRHSGYSLEVKWQSHCRPHRTTPIRLAYLNFMRSPKKATLTLLSLGICGVLLICGASIQSTITPEAISRSAMPNGNFRIRLTEDSYMLDADGTGRDEDRVQLEGNPLNEELREQVMLIDGVLEVRERAGLFIKLYAQGGDILIQETVYGYDERDYPRMEAFLDGTVAFGPDMSEAGLAIRAPEIFQEIYGWDPQIGEKVQMEYLDNAGKYRTQVLAITGLIGKSDGMDNFFRVPAALLKELTGYNIATEWDIQTDPATDELIEEELLRLLRERNNLTLDTYAARLRSEAAVSRGTYAVIYSLVGIFGLFGLINLVNTTVTSLLARRGEMALYRGLGMTARQLALSLFVEGTMYTAGAILVAVVLGVPIAMLVCRLCDPTGIIAYRFPVPAALLYTCLLFGVQVLLLFAALRTDRSPL